MKNILKSKLSQALLFVAVVTLLYGIFYVFADFHNMPYRGIKDFFILFMQWVAVEFAVFALLYLLSVNKYIFAITFPALSSFCSILSYFRFTTNVSFSADVIDLALVNDAKTCMEVITWPLIIFFAASIAISSVIVRIRFRHIDFSRNWHIASALALAVIIATNTIQALRNPISPRIPFCIYTAFNDYFHNKREISEFRPEFSGEIICKSDSLTVVFILGESVREKNLQIGGYHRATTPLLCQEKNVVAIHHIYSEYGFTHTSVPYLLTRADSLHHNRAYHERSFINLFKKAGYCTYWLSNQESTGTYVYFMNEADSLNFANSCKSVYSFDKWLDEDLLPLYRKALKGNSSHKLIILHAIGSHWWYNGHYTDKFAKWKPEAKSRVFSSNSIEELTNSYDNTILYSDHIWHNIINGVRQSNSIVIYLSDHSENLGEGGLYGHGQDHPASHYPGCWIWYSESFASKYPQKVVALRGNCNRPYNSSFLFHTILDAGDITTKYLEHSSNLFEASAVTK